MVISDLTIFFKPSTRLEIPELVARKPPPGAEASASGIEPKNGRRVFGSGDPAREVVETEGKKPAVEFGSRLSDPGPSLP